MSDLEHRLIHLITEFNLVKSMNLEMSESLRKKDKEIEKLRKIADALKNETSGSASERYRLRHLEKQRKQLSKQLQVLLNKLQKVEEYLSNEV